MLRLIALRRSGRLMVIQATRPFTSYSTSSAAPLRQSVAHDCTASAAVSMTPSATRASMSAPDSPMLASASIVSAPRSGGECRCCEVLAVEGDRRVHDRHLAQLRVRDGLELLDRRDLRVGEHAIERVDRRMRHVDRVEAREQLIHRELRRRRAEPRIHRVAVLHAFDIRLETGLVAQLGRLDRVEEPVEALVVADREEDEAVRRGERAVGDVAAEARAEALRNLAPGGDAHERRGHPGERRLQQRHLDVGSLAALLTRAKRVEDAEGQPHARAHVHHGQRNAGGRAVVRARHRDDARVGLQHRVVRRLLLSRAGVAVAAHLDIDEARVEFADPFRRRIRPPRARRDGGSGRARPPRR